MKNLLLLLGILTLASCESENPCGYGQDWHQHSDGTYTCVTPSRADAIVDEVQEILCIENFGGSRKVIKIVIKGEYGEPDVSLGKTSIGGFQTFCFETGWGEYSWDFYVLVYEYGKWEKHTFIGNSMLI